MESNSSASKSKRVDGPPPRPARPIQPNKPKRLSPQALAIRESVTQTILRHDLLPKGTALLIGLSGGVDSMALLSILLHLKPECDIAVAHCNFNLRGQEAQDDTQFVSNYIQDCHHRGKPLKLHVQHFDTLAYAQTHRLSIELAARELRYDWFNTLCINHGYDRIATGHNANDQAETLLLNLSRGAGLRGLGAIPYRNGRIIRPLLGITKAQILIWANELNLPWREDSTNSDPLYAARNCVRHNIIPQLEQLHAGAVPRMAATADYVQTIEKILIQEASLRYGNLPQNGPLEQNNLPWTISLNEMAPQKQGTKMPDLLLFWVRYALIHFGFHHDQITQLIEALEKKRGGIKIERNGMRCTLKGGRITVKRISDE